LAKAPLARLMAVLISSLQRCSAGSEGAGVRSSLQNSSSLLRATIPLSIASAIHCSYCTRSMMDILPP
jgi:hypothetical protein